MQGCTENNKIIWKDIPAWSFFKDKSVIYKSPLWVEHQARLFLGQDEPFDSTFVRGVPEKFKLDSINNDSVSIKLKHNFQRGGADVLLFKTYSGTHQKKLQHFSCHFFTVGYFSPWNQWITNALPDRFQCCNSL